MIKRIELIKTTNKYTSKTRLYMIDSKLGHKKLPISNNLWNWYTAISSRRECFHTQSDSKYTRQFQTIVLS